MTTLTPQQLIQLAEFAGWRQHTKTYGEYWRAPDGKIYSTDELKEHFNSLDACIRDLVGKMRDLDEEGGYRMKAEQNFSRYGPWKVTFAQVGEVYNGSWIGFTAESPTLSIAICLAVLKYLDSVSKNPLPQSASGV